MDPLSDVLSLLKPRSYMFGGIDAGGDWSILFGELEGINCYAIVSGRCRRQAKLLLRRVNWFRA